MTFTESIVEEATLAWFAELGYTHLHGPSIAPDEPAAERSSYADVLLSARLREAIARCNPTIPAEALDEAERKISRITSPQLVDANHELHRYLVEGVPVEYLRADGTIAYDHVRLLDFDDPRANDFVVVDQLTVKEGRHTRRPGVVVYVNGLPLGVVEIKNAADESATIWTAFQQLETYKDELPTLFTHNALLVVSDGLEARVGALSSDRERFAPWRTIEGEDLAPASMSQLEVLIRGAFEPHRLLDLIRFFIVFESDGKTDKNLAVELLRRLLADEIKTRSRHNLVQSRSFAALLEQAVRRYQNRAIEAAQVIEELIRLAKDVREADRRGVKLGLTTEEVAFYDALATNESAVQVLGDATLQAIARELVDIVRKNVSIDWTVKDSARARLRVIVKRILRKHGYPPDKQEAATDTVLAQAGELSDAWLATAFA